MFWFNFYLYFKTSLVFRGNQKLQVPYVKKNGSLYVSGKLPTYPSSKPTLTRTSHLGQNVSIGEGQLSKTMCKRQETGKTAHFNYYFPLVSSCSFNAIKTIKRVSKMAKYTRLKTPERKVTGTNKKYNFLIHELK